MKQTITFNNADFLPEVLRLIGEGHTVTLPLKGFSMRPFLEDGRDKALLTKVSKPNVGDPVLAIINKRYYVLHRIVGMVASVIGFYRKGSNRLDAINGWKWKAYSWAWMRLRPVRRWLLAFHRRVWIPLLGKH